MRYYIKEEEGHKCVVYEIDEFGQGIVVFSRSTNDRKEQCKNYKEKMEKSNENLH